MIPLGSPSLTPTPLSILSADFVQAFGRPAGLWLPCGGPEAKAYDLSRGELGGGNFGTLNGVVTTSGDGWGVLGRSWKGDGSTGSITTTTMPAISEPLTLWSLVIPTSVSGIHSLVYYGSNLQEWGLLINAGAVWALSQAGAVNNQATGGTVVANQAYLVTGVFASSSLRQVYLNDQLVGTDTHATTVSPTSPQANLFSRWSVSNQIFSGYELASGMFKSALTAAQVSALYASLQTGEPYRLFAPSAFESFYGFAKTAGGLLLARRRAAAA